MTNYQLLNTNKPFKLESGEVLDNLEIAYHTYGKLSAKKDNVIWVCHAITANSDAEDWWNGIVGENKIYNPDEYFIVCANILGSHYGTTGPLSVNASGEKYYRSFPKVTVRDMVQAHILLRKELNINKIHTVIGGSIGSFQAIEWSIIEPNIVENLIIIVGSVKITPWIVAFNETQRMAIRADKTFFEDNDRGGIEGMKAARAMALLSYRNDTTYNRTQVIENEEDYLKYKAVTYQQYQGEKLAKRFNAYSYYTLKYSVDSHDVGRGRGGVEKALEQIKAKTLIIAIDTDILFPLEAQKEMHKNIKNSCFEVIHSDFGHDGFLIENEIITKVIKKFYDKSINKEYKE